MNGTFESYDESLDESFDEAAESVYDESFDETAEFIGLPGIIGNVLGGLGGVAGSAASGIGNLLGGVLGGSRPTRPPLPGVQLPGLGAGVSNATLTTPAGTATLALPSPLVRQDEFRATTQRLQSAINRQDLRSVRLASSDSGVTQLGSQVGTEQTGAQFIERLSQFLGFDFQ